MTLVQSWMIRARAVTQHSHCGTSWTSLEAAFNIPMLRTSVLFRSVMYQPRRHSPSCGHWRISTREVCEQFRTICKCL